MRGPGFGWAQCAYAIFVSRSAFSKIRFNCVLVMCKWARILMTLLYELRRRGGGYGAAGICSGIAQGEATLVRVD